MRASRLRTGILLIGTGLILLGNTLGYLDWFVWEHLFKLWPVLIIAIGIELIFRKSKVYALSYISPLLILGCFIYAVFGGGAIAWLDRYYEKDSIEYVVTENEAGPIQELDIELDLDVGGFDFDVAGSNLFEGDFEYYGREPQFSYTRHDDVGRIKVKYREFKMRNHRRVRGCDSKIYITDKYPVKLEIDAGVAAMDIDLRDIPVTDLDIDSGVSDISIRIGDKVDHVETNIDIGVSDVSVYIPNGFAVRLHRKTGLSMVSCRDLGLIKVNRKLYESPGYQNSDKTVFIDIDAGISDITLRYYDPKRKQL